MFVLILNVSLSFPSRKTKWGKATEVLEKWGKATEVLKAREDTEKQQEGSKMFMFQSIQTEEVFISLNTFILIRVSVMTNKC